MTQSTIASVKQSLTPGALVELFDLDLSIFESGLVYHFHSASPDTILWQGNQYTPLPITAEGFEITGRGTLPTPSLKIANVNGIVTALVKQFGDPIGATLRRHRTFSQFLDSGSQADPNQHFPLEIWLIERKKNENRVYVEFELSASMDQEGRQLPGRQMIQGACTLRYRRWSSADNAFDYSQATCPWTGSDSVLGPIAGQGGTETPYFTEDGTPTGDPSQDKCGKTLPDCKCRYVPLKLALPFGGFPSIGKIR